eukprot:CAMPEP_0116147452 /NCGR_PEP_ID=MMETSP0329-20121206/17761_1 /TAXON_ID=697910 /ORGANISM="Pseudo-nitzschia arenysensis, Strain B593" /LENGTH=740 /DNA_ID=CAMNT_0003643379 /DNA_START=211 /DNA_END=2433 /DNA_ORIENTATION=+
MKKHAFLLAAFLLLGQMVVSSATAATAPSTASLNSSTTRSNDQGFVSLQLTNRHTELERRRRERKLSGVTVTLDSLEQELELDNNNNDNDNNNEEQYRRREEAVQVGALFEGYGTHYIDLWCGSPPQRQTVIVDTGSGVTAFPCSGCRDCGVPDYHIDRLFVEEESDTFQESTCVKRSDCIMDRSNCQGGTCKIGMSYAEGSRWNAYEAVDRCYVAGPHETPLIADANENENEKINPDADDMDPKHAAELAFDMTFGCQTVVTGLFKTQLADGIMGMSNQASTFWSQMFKAGKMGSDRQFSLCFSRPPSVTREGTEAGAMTLGGSDKRLHTSPMVYTAQANKGRASFFSVKVRKFMLRDGKYGESVQSTAKNPNMGVTELDIDESVINTGGIIVDSGTTDTYWNQGISRAFNKVFQEKAGFAHHNQAMSLTEDQLKNMPTILLQLYSDDATNSHVDKYKTPGLAGAMDTAHPSDVILAIPPSHYMEYNPEKKKYTSRFYPTERSGSVLGANAMMGHDVFFDIDSMRIGWAESDCDYTSTVKGNGYDFEITGELKDAEHLAKYQKHHNKHNNNNNNQNVGQFVCDTITSGNKCQKTEGCTWGWGKCTSKKADDESPTESPTWYPTDSPTDDHDDDSVEQQIINIDALKEQAQNHQKEILVAAIVSFVLLCCCCYALFCRSGKRDASSKGKYARTALDPSIEMTNGEGFQDEPDADQKSNGSRSSSQFRDNPDEPEFEGDFA